MKKASIINGDVIATDNHRFQRQRTGWLRKKLK